MQALFSLLRFSLIEFRKRLHIVAYPDNEALVYIYIYKMETLYFYLWRDKEERAKTAFLIFIRIIII